MSLWTPDGERPVSKSSQPDAAASPESGAGAPPPELAAALAEAGIDISQLSPDQLQEAAAMLAEMGRVRQEMLAVPAAVIIANHLMGIYELAAIHLGENPPNFVEAAVAIESLKAVLDRMGKKFGENETVLRQALQQLEMTFVALKDQVAAESAPPEPGIAANE